MRSALLTAIAEVEGCLMEYVRVGEVERYQHRNMQDKIPHNAYNCREEWFRDTLTHISDMSMPRANSRVCGADASSQEPEVKDELLPRRLDYKEYVGWPLKN